MKNCFLALIACFSFSAGFSQIDTSLERLANDFQPEKVFLHYDKSAYLPGETIWFKAYLMEEIYPSANSKNFYVDWVSEEGKVLYHTVSPVIDGTTNGQFEIPADYAGQVIHVRAYTRWMLNFDTAFLYSKDIPILRHPGSAAKNNPPAIQPTLQFFPEGGDAIEGIINTIAFKATDQYGRPVKIRGLIQDNKGGFVDSLRSLHDGMGKFFLNPQPGISYTARWKDEKGVERTTALPAAKSTGVAMQVNNSGQRTTIVVNASINLPAHMKQLHLIGTINQRLAFKTELSLAASNSVRRVIPIEALPAGIMTITLFDAGWNALAERIVFIKNPGYSFQPSFEVKHWGLGKRKRNQIEITLPDSLDDANLSISVTDAAIERDSSENIISRLLLTSDIRGYVHQPAYYFSSDNETMNQHLDLVMLTHGWRRFKWEDVVNGKTPPLLFPKDTAYLHLSGKLFGVARSQLSGNDNIVLLVKEDTSTRMLIMPISTSGSFGDPEVIIFDTIQVYYSLKSKFFKSAEARFMPDRLPAPNYTSFSKNLLYRPFRDTSGSFYHARLAYEAVQLQEKLKGKMMENVTVRAKQKSTKQQLDEKYASGMFQGGDGYQFDMVNDPLAMTYMNAFSYLQGKVAGLQINTSDNPPTLSWRGGEPALYLDEIATDASLLSSIPVADIAYIKVFRPPFMGGFGGSNGAIAIYTRKGADIENRPGSGLTTNKVMGYTPIREFYSPNYDRFDARHQEADTRTTLYWNPQVILKGNKRSVMLSFYNNDVTQVFRVVITGMTRDGLMTHFEQIME